MVYFLKQNSVQKWWSPFCKKQYKIFYSKFLQKFQTIVAHLRVLKFGHIDLMHKSRSGRCILGNGNLRIVIGHSSQTVTNNNAQIPVSQDTRPGSRLMRKVYSGTKIECSTQYKMHSEIFSISSLVEISIM